MWSSDAPCRPARPHPEAGLLDFDIEIVTAPHAPDQHLIVYTAESGSSTARVLPILASWAGPAGSPSGPSGPSAPAGSPSRPRG